MKRLAVLRWFGLVFLVLALGAVIGGVIVYAANSQSESAAGVTEKVVADDPDAGVVIAQVTADGPAAEAGVVRGDILLAVNGEPVDSSYELQSRLSDLEVGDQVELQVLHGDDERTRTATLGEQNGRPYLGVVPCGHFSVPDLEIVLPEITGAVIVRVVPDSPADEAGLEVGDRIVGVDGQAPDAEQNLADLIAAHAPGDEVTLGIERAGEDALEIRVVLGEHPDDEEVAYLGVEYLPFPHLEGIEGHLRPFFELPEGELEAGAIIQRVEEDSPADAAGLSEGDVIVAIDGEDIGGPRDLVDAIGASEPGDTVTLTVLDPAEDEERDVRVTLADKEGGAYLGVVVGGFFRGWRFEGEVSPFEVLPFDIPPFDEAPFFELPEGELESGVIIQRVDEDSPADAAGLREGDVITAIDDEKLERPQDLVDAVAEREPGDAVKLTVYDREAEQEREVQVTLAEHPEQEGKAYLGLFIGGFFRSFRSGEPDERPWMQLFEGFLERFRGRQSFDGEDRFRFRFDVRPRDLLDQFPFDFDFELPPDLFEEAPCCAGDVTA